MGALPLKTAGYLLPDEPAHRRNLESIAQRIADAGGEANIVLASEIQGLTDANIVRLFHEARATDYIEWSEDAEALQRKRARISEAQVRIAVGRLRAWLDEITAADFFQSPSQATAAALMERLEQPEPVLRKPNAHLRRDDFIGRVWMTRPRPQMDRVASAWLIRRFVDPKARFVFADDVAAHPDAVSFDMRGAMFGHQDGHPTVHNLMASFDVRDAGVRRVIQMIEAANLREAKEGGGEIEGVRRVLRGLIQLGKTDEQILATGFDLFEALHASFASANSGR